MTETPTTDKANSEADMIPLQDALDAMEDVWQAGDVTLLAVKIALAELVAEIEA